MDAICILATFCNLCTFKKCKKAVISDLTELTGSFPSDAESTSKKKSASVSPAQYKCKFVSCFKSLDSEIANQDGDQTEDSGVWTDH